MGRKPKQYKYVKENDGRRNNGRKQGVRNVPVVRPTSSAALNDAKRKRVGIYALNAMAKVFWKRYKIYPVPLPGCIGRCVKFNLEVDYKGVKKKGTKVYTDKEWSDAIWKIYKFLYEKNGKKTKAI